jgi:formylglycine-generating enzyme
MRASSNDDSPCQLNRHRFARERLLADRLRSKSPLWLLVLLSNQWLVSCGARSDIDEHLDDTSAAGRFVGVGGKGTTGGPWNGAGGRGGVGGTSAASGGNSAIGGSHATGGTTSAGGVKATGGSSPTGGASRGGTATTGGAITTGGSRATGGATSSGGSRPTGGAPTGGIAPTGGTKATGGMPTTGGTTSSGGSRPTGGAPTGGTVASGGTPLAGGASSGAGAPTGGSTSMAGATHTAGAAGVFASGGAAVTGGAAGAAGSAGAPATTPPSCLGLPTLCQGESCCTTIKVTGGTFAMGRSQVSGATDYFSSGFDQETPEHDATVANFALDKYEVTVGRYRAFVNNYDAWHKPPASNPHSGDGANPNVAASNRDLTGWAQSWTPSPNDLPTDATALASALDCTGPYATWKNSADTNEAYPITCVSWYMAFAFCIWDGGWLPTEAEWEYAAAGGAENRLYPWGGAAPDSSRANYLDTDGSPFVPVGSKGSAGAGVFGHADLAGSMYEWVFDWYSTSYYGTAESPVVCDRCANTTHSNGRVLRDGCWDCAASQLRAAFRQGNGEANRGYGLGFRCARSPW